jgi:hypothetical protein
MQKDNLRPQHRARSTKDQLPRVGIVFVVGIKIFIESTPVDQGEACAGFVNHAGGHEAFWERLWLTGDVPEEPYESVPRGRAIFDQSTGKYVLYLDKCITTQPNIVRSIRTQLNLPASTQIRFDDSHYRCSACLNKKANFEDE